MQRAVRSGRLSNAIWLVEKGVDLNPPAENDPMWSFAENTLWHFAAMTNSSHFIKALLQTNIFPEGEGSSSGESSTKKILDQNAINVRNNDGETPLHLVIREGCSVEVIAYLVEKGANLDAEGSHGNTIWHYAARRKDDEATQWLCDYYEKKNQKEKLKKHINQPNKLDGFPLLEAILANQFQEVELLIEKGADINRVDEDENNIWHFLVNKIQGNKRNGYLAAVWLIANRNKLGITHKTTDVNRNGLSAVEFASFETDVLPFVKELWKGGDPDKIKTSSIRVIDGLSKQFPEILSSPELKSQVDNYHRKYSLLVLGVGVLALLVLSALVIFLFAQSFFIAAGILLAVGVVGLLGLICFGILQRYPVNRSSITSCLEKSINWLEREEEYHPVPLRGFSVNENAFEGDEAEDGDNSDIENNHKENTNSEEKNNDQKNRNNKGKEKVDDEDEVENEEEICDEEEGSYFLVENN